MMGRTKVSNIRTPDMLFLEQLFEFDSGYVLNFFNREYARFFAEEVNVDIDDSIWSRNGGSKGKRLRTFLQSADKPNVVRALKALWDYRKEMRERFGHEETVKNAEGRLLALINELEAGSRRDPQGPTAKPAYDRHKFCNLADELLKLSNLSNPQARGLAFGRFLRDLFNAFGLEARDAFRLWGEQIDGSFVLSNEIYLLEAKWQGTRSGYAELHAFHGKLEQKAAWTRGLFISQSGFTEEGLDAFGRGKRVICMDGLDLHDALSRELPLDEVLRRKVRRAAETGGAFARVRELF